MRPGLIACVVVMLALGSAGCGSGTTPGTSQSPASGGSQAGNGEAGKTAAQIVADTAAALGRVHSFHIQGSGADVNGAPVHLNGDFALPGRMRLELSEGNKNVAFVLAGGFGYVRGNRVFWSAHAHSPRVTALLANRWIKVPPAVTGVAQFQAWTNPATIGHCVVESHLGTVTIAGKTMYEGHPVVILRNHGNIPGSAPGDLYVTTMGQPLALRETQTAPKRPGGTRDRTCGETSVSPSTTKTSDLTLSAYNQAVHITAPAGAITIPGLGGKTA